MHSADGATIAIHDIREADISVERRIILYNTSCIKGLAMSSAQEDGVWDNGSKGDIAWWNGSGDDGTHFSLLFNLLLVI